MPDYDVSEPLDTDYYSVFANISAPDREVWNRARAFTAEALPQMNDYWERAEFPAHLAKRMGS